MTGEIDGIDIYVGRCLKNWTARYHPPEDGREQLLHQVAVSPAHTSETRLYKIFSLPKTGKSPYSLSWQRRLEGFFISVYRPSYRSRGEVIWGPIVQSQLFFANHSWSWRLAH